MLTLFGNLESGNVHKVQAILHRLGVVYRRVEVSQVQGHPSTGKYLALNPMRKVPAVLLENGDMLSESGALLYWFGRDTELWPASERARTEVLRWMFFEQYSHEPALAVMRYLRRFTPPTEDNARRVAELAPRAHHALGVMNRQLESSPWLAGATYSLADIALYPYTKWADQAGIDLASFEHIRSWLERAEAEARFLPVGAEGAAQVIAFDDYFQ